MKFLIITIVLLLSIQSSESKLFRSKEVTLDGIKINGKYENDWRKEVTKVCEDDSTKLIKTNKLFDDYIDKLLDVDDKRIKTNKLEEIPGKVPVFGDQAVIMALALPQKERDIVLKLSEEAMKIIDRYFKLSEISEAARKVVTWKMAAGFGIPCSKDLLLGLFKRCLNVVNAVKSIISLSFYNIKILASKGKITTEFLKGFGKFLESIPIFGKFIASSTTGVGTAIVNIEMEGLNLWSTRMDYELATAVTWSTTKVNEILDRFNLYYSLDYKFVDELACGTKRTLSSFMNDAGYNILSPQAKESFCLEAMELS